MSDNEAPPAPDYTPIADAQKKMAQQQNAMSMEQFEWAKKVYGENKEITDKVVAGFLKTQERNDANAIADRERYERIYQPLEDDLAQEARDYASPERREREMGKAQANVAQQFGAARVNAQRNLEAFGIDPEDTRYAALDIGFRAQQAAAAAGAGNQASDMVDATGRALRSEALNIGKGYPGQIAGTYNTALQAGSGANQQGLATTNSGANTMGTGVQWGAQAGSNYTGAANTMNMGFQNQLSAAKYNQDAQGQWMTLAGAGLGAGTKLATAGLWGVADGGAIDGGHVPEQVSPSRGVEVDDVPARLNVGEFIMPEEAVRWYGEEKFHKMIVKAREDKEELKKESGAVPKPIPPSAMGGQGAGARRQALEVA
jgi:hypothetical protein